MSLPNSNPSRSENPPGSLPVSSPEFPVAEVRSRQSEAGWPVLSRMWLATACCVLAAIGLVWYSMEPAGTKVLLHFQEGHGLRPGDPLRNRGIDVGKVIRVELNPELSGIDVQAELQPAAKGLAREGTRFWIVRPTIDASGISGLETAVGPKYIAVSPGAAESGEARFEFVGLEHAAVDGTYASGMELVLRGAERYGINPGSPITWRGVEVGQVLSCGLSPDALHVDIQIRINAAHARLVTSATRFWVLSGVQLDAGLTGLKVSAESLATIVRGGIGLITPDSKEAQLARTGDVFTLHPEEDEAWTERATAINLLQLSPPQTLPLKATWQQKTLGFTRSFERESLGIPVNQAGQAALLVPAGLLQVPAESVAGSFKLSLEASDEEPTVLELALPPGSSSDLLVKLPLPAASIALLPDDRMRIASEPEDCFAARLSSPGEALLESIGRHELSATDGRWIVSKRGLNPGIWHGAAVLSARDGKLIGLLVSDDSGIFVATLQ